MKRESFELYQQSGKARTIRIHGWVAAKRGKLPLNSLGHPTVYLDKERAKIFKPRGYRLVAVEVKVRVAEQS